MPASSFLRWATLAFIAGVFVSSYVVIPFEILGVVCLVLLLCMSLSLGPERRTLFIIVGIILFVVIGAWRMEKVSSRPHVLDARVTNTKTEITLTGVITQDPVFDGRIQRSRDAGQKD